MDYRFPEGFQWGAATSAIQIEGATQEDGRGETIWDRYAQLPGRIMNGDTPNEACDHYHRYREDLSLMSELGIKAYRFSIAWSRILPSGKAPINRPGLAFYERLIDELLRAGITPYATLYHWDLPQALEDEGGWLNRDTSNHYVHYIDTVSRFLGDRVKHWITFNEPQCISNLSYVWGVSAPGHRDLTYTKANQVTHNILLSHGKTIPILRVNSAGAKIGIVLNMGPVHPASTSEADCAAARRVDDRDHRWFADPLFKGQYPTERLALLGDAAPKIEDGDMKIISTAIDFLGVNYYTRTVVADDTQSSGAEKARHVHVEAAEYTHTDWEVYPDGLREQLVRLHEEYEPNEILITENGCAAPDSIGADGQVHDPQRVSYLRRHFAAMNQAIREGVPLKGYFVWSLMDNFEWSLGYTKRFGIIYVDYATQRRIPKDSFRFYQQVIRDNAVSDD